MSPPLAAPPPGNANAQPALLDNVTVRQLLRTSAAARRIRLRISNELNQAPLHLGAVHIALAGADGSIVAGTDHALTFSGQAAVTVPADAPLLSDPIEWQLPAFTQLAASLYLPTATEPAAHRLSVYISAAGDSSAAVQMPGASLVRSGALVSEVEIDSPTARRVLVALGDSITEGVGSTTNAFRAWPDRLAERLQANAATRDWSVVNAGIGSNRLLHNNPGRGALARFDRDVLGVPGVAAVLLLEGINDIGYGQTTPAEAVSADEIIAAYRQLILRAHAHGLAIVAATIPPFEDSHYYDLAGEQRRLAVNEWLRRQSEFDGLVDFDRALRDPAHPSQVLATLHRGDHLHPNDEGYQAMANAIDLQLFAKLRKPR
jgi:lysophospholipase L1-like esterase